MMKYEKGDYGIPSHHIPLHLPQPMAGEHQNLSIPPMVIAKPIPSSLLSFDFIIHLS
jgi:hypothetical protein